MLTWSPCAVLSQPRGAHISPHLPHISPISRSHASRRIDEKDNQPRFQSVQALGLKHLPSSVPPQLRTSSPDYEPRSPLPTNPLAPAGEGDKSELKKKQARCSGDIWGDIGEI